MGLKDIISGICVGATSIAAGAVAVSGGVEIYRLLQDPSPEKIIGVAGVGTFWLMMAGLSGYTGRLSVNCFKDAYKDIKTK